jgi:DNA-binding transcriptional regulator/RsmH inhibitor MraZ
MIAPHERDSCLVGYDPDYASTLYAEQERLRLGAAGSGTVDARARRVFGRVEEAECASDGAISLPAILRQKGGILDHALFVGTAGMFEIWDPVRALESGDAALSEIAAWRVHRDLPPASKEA